MSDPIEPEELQDPLAPTMSPGRGALAPQRATESTEEWGIQMALDYGYVGSASLSKGLGTATEQAAELSADDLGGDVDAVQKDPREVAARVAHRRRY